jgi:hypothetical protein
MASIEDQLKRILYRAFCPESIELGEYQAGRLPAERREAIREHLRDCPFCIQELEELRNFLEETGWEIEPGPLEKLRIIVARLLDVKGGLGARPPLPGAPALQGVRGGASRSLIYEAEGILITLDFQADPERQESMTLIGLVSAPEPIPFDARLHKAGVFISSTPVDEFGNFKLSPILSGTYALILSSPAVEIQIEELIAE